jgi:hypothetical protein
MATVKPQKILDSKPQHPKRNDDSKVVKIGTAKGHAVSGAPHIAKHAVGKLGSNKKVY